METIKMTSREFREYLRDSRMGKNQENKFHAKKVCGYDSKKEYLRALTLKTLAEVGAITGLREQLTFILIPAQRDENGNLLERAVTYKADFVYRDREGNLIVEDTKGYRTKEYIIKRKLMLYVHGIRIIER